MANPKGLVVPKYVKRVCNGWYDGQGDPLYSVASTGRVYGRSHAGDCAYNLRISFPKFDQAPKEVQRTLRYFNRVEDPQSYLDTLREVRAGLVIKTW